MKRIAKFEKVSEEIFINSGYTKEEYKEYSLPLRATAGSAGYDFFAVREFTLNPHETLDNTVGIIDGDYYYSDNEGHIFVRATNLGEKPFTVKKGQGFCQGIFSEYGITEDDNATNVRNGGFGSTDNKTR